MALAAGLVVGGVVGVGMTGAASETGGSDGVVHPAMEHAGRGPDGAREHVREILDALVTEGTLTAEQADRVVDALAAAGEARMASRLAERDARRAERMAQMGDQDHEHRSEWRGQMRMRMGMRS